MPPVAESWDNAVSHCDSLMNQTVLHPVDESAEIVRWNKALRLGRALTDGTHEVSAKDIAEKNHSTRHTLKWLLSDLTPFGLFGQVDRFALTVTKGSLLRSAGDPAIRSQGHF
jgi:hypothetical protein